MEVTVKQYALEAAHVAIKKLSSRLEQIDYENAEQAAVEGWRRAMEERPSDERYAIVSARYAATKYVIREIWGYNPLGILRLEDVEEKQK